MTIISKNWTYTIEGHDFTLLMAPSEDMLTVKTTISMDGHGPMLVLGFTDDCIITEQQIRIIVHGKDVVEDGLSLHNIAVVKKAYTDMLFHVNYSAIKLPSSSLPFLHIFIYLFMYLIKIAFSSSSTR